MKSFKSYILEDIWNVTDTPENLSKQDPKEMTIEYGFATKQKNLVHTVGDYSIYHSTMPFLNLNSGHFVLKHNPSGEIAGYVRYLKNSPSRNEIEIKNVVGSKGHSGVRSMLYDTIADKLGYTIVSDRMQTPKGKKGWLSDIATGKNIHVRTIDDRTGRIISQKKIDPKNFSEKDVWTSGDYNIGDNVLLVRHPEGT